MAKFKVKFKIQALELEIEGDRESIPSITQALQGQIAGMLGAPSAIMAPEEAIRDISPIQSVEATQPKPGRKKNSRPKSTAPANKDTASAAFDFQHAPDKWGNPKQTWSAPKKAMWLLFVTESQASVVEMSSGEIAATFNKHFRQAGAITVSQLNRDLGAAKSKSPAQVGEDTTKTPPKWYLTEAGKAVARKQVEEALGSPAT